ncbi:hypothetical protein D1007_17990 [Hordeum vulgare]|nr:hypothetical protein D1007_17990 [Hordeum vulgare]
MGSSSTATLLPVKREWADEPEDRELIAVKQEQEEIARRGIVIAERSLHEEAESRYQDEELEYLMLKQAVAASSVAKEKDNEWWRILEEQRAKFINLVSSDEEDLAPPPRSTRDALRVSPIATVKTRARRKLVWVVARLAFSSAPAGAGDSGVSEKIAHVKKQPDARQLWHVASDELYKSSAPPRALPPLRASPRALCSSLHHFFSSLLASPSSESSGYRGVCERPSGNFYAEIRSGDMRLGLGTFDTADQAALAYDAAAWRLWRPRKEMNLPEVMTLEWTLFGA